MDFSSTPSQTDSWIQETVYTYRNETNLRYLNNLLQQTNLISQEIDQIKNETDEWKSQVRQFEKEMQWAEDRMESMRRERNRAAVILWNFPADLHPDIVQSITPQEKIDIMIDFFCRTVGIAERDIEFMALEHVMTFHNSYKNQRSVNVRIQFVDEEAKSICESCCIPFLKIFNQNRDSPTRWKDDQTELQREEVKQQQQNQQATTSRPGQLLFTKMIRWPPTQKA